MAIRSSWLGLYFNISAIKFPILFHLNKSDLIFDIMLPIQFIIRLSFIYLLSLIIIIIIRHPWILS